MAIGYNEAQKARTEQFWKQQFSKLERELAEAERKYKTDPNDFTELDVKQIRKLIEQAKKDRKFQLGY
jgi:predicted lipid-binding transport protein (Tim44 family)